MTFPDGVSADFTSDWSAFCEAFLSHSRTTPDCLAALIDNHPDVPIGPIAKGYLLLLLAKSELRAAAQDALDEGIGRGALGDCDRLRNLAEGLRSWLAGDPKGAVRHIENVIARHPQDAFSVKLSHAIRFTLGDADGMRRSLARVVSIYTEDVPFSGYVKGCYAFALEETGDYREAERMGRRAVSLAPCDAWGRHAVAHVLEMTGRANEGLAWLGRDDDWRHCNNFGFHMLWHRALFMLELGQVADALALYDTGMRAEHSDDFRDIANAASLLQRLELIGVHVGGRWDELADKAERRVDDRQLAFADLHYMLALLGAGRLTPARRLAEGLLTASTGHNGEVSRDIAGPCAEALVAFQRGDHGAAVLLLTPVLPLLQGIGGSHAQRDIFAQIWLESLVRSGHPLAERHLSLRRLARNGCNSFAQDRLLRFSEDRASGRAALAALALTPPTPVH
jgi:tetratricopeptide (TPR) repeat protein